MFGILKPVLQSKDSYYTYLAFFRVFLALHILKKYFFYFPVLKDVLGENALTGPTTDELLISLGITNASAIYVVTALLITAVFMLFGIGKNYTIAVVYILVEIVQRLNGYLLNGGDNFLKFLLLYMIFANSFTRFTLFGSSKACKEESIPHLLNALAVFSIKVHLCLIYFISGLFKANSKVWFHGVATYYTLSLERFSATDLNKTLVQNGLFVTLSTYTVLLWELFFPVLIWKKTLRLPLLSLGFLIHLGIYFMMMIHDFEIVFIATYGFFITDKEWAAFGKRISGFSWVSNLAARLPKG